MTEVCILTTNQSICSGKLCSCGIQVDFQNQCDGFLMWKKKYNFGQNKPVKKIKCRLWKEVTEQHLMKKKKQKHFTMNSCLSQTFPMGEDSKFGSTVNWSTR